MHIYAGITLDLLYFGTKRPLSKFSGRNQTGMSICLTIVVTILSSTTEVQLVLSSQFTAGSPVWNDKYYMNLRIALVFLTALYSHLISPSVES